MANRRYPGNHHKNNGRNNNNRNNNNIRINCPQCGDQIRIVNDDIQFSLNLHMQSHKSLDSIDQDIDRQLSRARLGPNVQRNVQSNYVCPECDEKVQIFDNDVKRSLELHAQKHQRPGIGTRGDDQSSTSSGRSRHSNRKQNYLKNNPGPKSEGMKALDNTFYKMQPGLKAHRGFVYENETGELFCGLCNVKIDSLYKIADHLVTKSHEDNTISFIKTKLPYELHETMDFVSFYGSNLCCNLCRCKIDLNSLNLSETIMNIIAHNAGQQHVNKRGKNEPVDRPSEGIKKLNYLASLDSVIRNNKHVISCEMKPQFKCKLCEKFITFDQNDQMLLKNFTSHFTSNGHNKCARATSVLTMFKSSYQPRGGKHNLVVTKGSITCTVCNISFEPSLETLDAHVKEVDGFTNIEWPEDLSARVNKLDFKGPQNTFNEKRRNDEAGESKLSKLNVLLKSMPPPYRNVDCVVESSQGQVTCLICNCVIPATFYNLKTHLMGSSHMKNLSSTKDEFGVERPPNNSSTTTSATPQNFNPFMKDNSSLTMNAMSEIDNGMSKALDYLKTSDFLIQKNGHLLTKHNGNIFSCKLCKMTFPKFNDVESFKEDLISHFNSPKHKQLYADSQKSEIEKLLSADPIVRDNKKYLRVHEESLLCTLCDSLLSISIDGTKLKKNLTDHLKGQQHQSKVNAVANQEASEPVVFSSNSMESLKAQYNFSKSSEFANNAKNPSGFQFPVEQFKGPQNLNKSEESTNRPLKKPSPFLLPNPTDPPRAQPMEDVKPKDLNFELPKTFPNSISTDPIMELFRKLPASFQSDIAFIKKSGVVDGFLACTICNINHINPPYLQKHLEEEKHAESKRARRPSPAVEDTQRSTPSNKMMKSMKNLFGFSN